MPYQPVKILQPGASRSKLQVMFNLRPTAMQPLRNYLPRHKILSAGALWLLGLGQANAIEITIPLPGGVDSYAECVLDAITPDLGGVALQALTSDCRSRFHQPSKPGMFGPRSIDSCFQKNQDRISSRAAAKVVFSACQDYFSADSPDQPTALRGSRLRAQ